MSARPMLSVAMRNMAAGKGRTAFSVAGVAVATLLLVFVIGLYRGWNGALAEYVEKTPADIWVVGEGADSFFTPSILFTTTIAPIRDTAGVERADSVVGRPMKLRRGDERWDSYVVGFDAGAAGGPVRMKKGSGTPKDFEIVIDDVLARTSGLDIGDEVIAGRTPFKVVGIAEGGNLVLAQLSFVAKDAARSLLGLDQIVSFVLVQTAEGEEDAVVERINANVPGVAAYRSEVFTENSQKVLRRSILPVLLVIVVMAVIVGTIVVGLTVYTAVVEKEREFGIMKAFGVPASGLLRVVFEQSIACGGAGFVVGVGLAFLTGWLAEMTIPQVTTEFWISDLALVLAAAAIMSLLAGVIPMQRVIRVDAMSIFKA